MDALTQVPHPVNEPVLDYSSGSDERAAVESALKTLQGDPIELTMTIGGAQSMGGGEPDRRGAAARPPQRPRHDAQRHR
jgi:1-pyrroline-5-carboxylate dehydrogenase